jgi:hypothetical protein
LDRLVLIEIASFQQDTGPLISGSDDDGRQRESCRVAVKVKVGDILGSDLAVLDHRGTRDDPAFLKP